MNLHDRDLDRLRALSPEQSWGKATDTVGDVDDA